MATKPSIPKGTRRVFHICYSQITINKQLINIALYEKFPLDWGNRHRHRLLEVVSGVLWCMLQQIFSKYYG